MRSVITLDLHSAYISQILEPSPQRQLKFWLNNWRHKCASCRILFESKYVSKKESTNTFYVDILFEIWVRGCKFWLDSTIFFLKYLTPIWFRIWKCWENCRQISLCALTWLDFWIWQVSSFFLQACIESSKPMRLNIV